MTEKQWIEQRRSEYVHALIQLLLPPAAWEWKQFSSAAQATAADVMDRIERLLMDWASEVYDADELQTILDSRDDSLLASIAENERRMDELTKEPGVEPLTEREAALVEHMERVEQPDETRLRSIEANTCVECHNPYDSKTHRALCADRGTDAKGRTKRTPSSYRCPDCGAGWQSSLHQQRCVDKETATFQEHESQALTIVAPSEHAHHWILGEPTDEGMVPGHCDCGEQRDFPEQLERAEVKR